MSVWWRDSSHCAPRGCGDAFPHWARRMPRPQIAGVAGLLGAFGYAALAGFALPTVRTVLMIAVVVLARLSRRQARVVDSLALAVIAVLLFDPLSVLAAGFWLSFAGVAWLAWCLPQSQHWAKGFLSAQGAATLGLLPLTVVLFGQASAVGPLVNLVAIPWWSLVVVPLSLVGTALEAMHAGAGAWAWRVAAWCFDLTWPLFTDAGGKPFFLVVAARSGLVRLAVGLAGCVLAAIAAWCARQVAGRTAVVAAAMAGSGIAERKAKWNCW